MIGAGTAGLYAARELRRGGHDVTVLEARDRIGGRLWTDEWEGRRIDLGASWIHGVKGNPVTELAEEAQAATVVLNTGTLDYGSRTGTVCYAADGRRLTRYETEEREADQEAAGEELAGLATRVGVAESAAAGLRRVLDGSGLGPDRARRVLEAHSRMTEDDWGAGIDEISLAGMAGGEGFEGDEVVFPDGYGRLAEHLAQGLDVRLGHKVTRVEHGGEGADGGVTVHTGGHGAFTADRVLLTLPLGVLKAGDVDFTPALPEAKRGAVERLGMGVYDKLYLLFPDVFWDDKEVIRQEGTPHGAFANWYNLRHVLGAPVLVALNGGPVARRLEELDDATAVGEALTALRSIYGGKVPEPLAYRITRWAADPWARGSYSFPATGSRPGDHDALAEPVGDRLYFAGEATTGGYCSTVHGALLSGRREARRILGT
ncbi:NAD(P)/FAD-dependent oxidoreductase [Streptomyces sp. NPDC026206]|uniref:flavin monoamine oxidase family protein n=1 Tax=Streptomyces sp. NPDC026206 TaxID=3157089 RepID=UPI0034072291